MIQLMTALDINVAVKTLVDTMLTALQFVIPLVVALFILTKALDRQVEIKLLIGEGLVAAIGLELLFAFAKNSMG